MSSRQDVLNDIEETLGFVPDWLGGLPDANIDGEWQVLKGRLIGESAIPNKYKELIGLAVAAQMQCEYSVALHAEFARYFGATDDEVKDAVQMAKETAGWSTYFNGLQLDMAKFKREVREVCDAMALRQRAA